MSVCCVLVDISLINVQTNISNIHLLSLPSRLLLLSAVSLSWLFSVAVVAQFWKAYQLFLILYSFSLVIISWKQTTQKIRINLVLFTSCFRYFRSRICFMFTNHCLCISLTDVSDCVTALLWCVCFSFVSRSVAGASWGVSESRWNTNARI